MPRKATTSTEESAIVSEQAEQEQPSGKAIYMNTCEAIGRLTDESSDLHQSIDAKQSEISEIEAEINQAEQIYAGAEEKKDDIAQKIATQRTRYEMSRGTAAESGDASLLAGLLSHAEDLQKAMEQTASARNEAEKKQPLVGALQKDIEDDQTKLAEIVTQLRQLERVKSDAFDLWGEDEERAIIAEIEGLQDALVKAEQSVPATLNELRGVQRSIASRLKAWSFRAYRVEQSHGVKYGEEEQWTPEEHCLHAQIAFMETLGKWGPKCRLYIHGRVPISTVLQLPQNIVMDLMNEHSSSWKELFLNGEFARKHALVGSAEALIENERDARTPKRNTSW